MDCCRPGKKTPRYVVQDALPHTGYSHVVCLDLGEDSQWVGSWYKKIAYFDNKKSAEAFAKHMNEEGTLYFSKTWGVFSLTQGSAVRILPTDSTI